MKIILASLMTLLAATSFAVGLGDPAPALKVSQWVSGEAVDPSKPGEATYLILFFDAALPNSAQAVAGLDEIGRSIADGKVTCVAVAEGDAEVVKKLIAEAKPAARVAMDDARTTLKAYSGEGEVELPLAVVVGKEATVLWSGPPSEEVLGALDQIVQGKYDVNSAKGLAHWRSVLNNALAKRDVDAVLRALNEIIKLDPRDYQHYGAKVSILRVKGDRAEIVKTRRAAAEALVGSADGLNTLAWDLVLEQELELRDPELAVKCAEESVKLSKRKEAASLDTLARAWYELGMVEKAIELQKESLAASADAHERAQVSGALEYYQAVLKAREKALKPITE